MEVADGQRMSGNVQGLADQRSSILETMTGQAQGHARAPRDMQQFAVRVFRTHPAVGRLGHVNQVDGGIRLFLEPGQVLADLAGQGFGMI